MQNRKRDTDVQNRLFDSVGEGEAGMFWENTTETSILPRVKQITCPGWMHETSAQGWCTGKTQRDGMGREVGGGIRMGNTCKFMADSCQCMAKTTTILYSGCPPNNKNKWRINKYKKFKNKERNKRTNNVDLMESMLQIPLGKTGRVPGLQTLQTYR